MVLLALAISYYRLEERHQISHVTGMVHARELTRHNVQEQPDQEVETAFIANRHVLPS